MLHLSSTASHPQLCVPSPRSHPFIGNNTKGRAFLHQAVAMQKRYKHDKKISSTKVCIELLSHPEQSPEQKGEVPSHLKSHPSHLQSKLFFLFLTNPIYTVTWLNFKNTKWSEKTILSSCKDKYEILRVRLWPLDLLTWLINTQLLWHLQAILQILHFRARVATARTRRRSGTTSIKWFWWKTRAAGWKILFRPHIVDCASSISVTS